MRIQHNVMAMNAYRNYSNNTSALSKNLERLSSGYKINRAGDDAAGLAISEKMRAQITGLEAAQKNVKDGISLVNTAEGAMQEVQDMLNRMVYLAQESANGTYDNEVDRANLQKEMDQLNAEIDRIADSANFNGIKLLDGSLSSKTIAAEKAVTGMTDLAADNISHIADAASAPDPQKGKFSLDLSEVSVTNNGTKATITDPGLTTSGAVDGGDGTDANDPDDDIAATFDVALTGAQISKATGAGQTAILTVAGQKIEFDVSTTADMAAADIANAIVNKTITIDGQEYTATIKTGGNGDTLLFTSTGKGATVTAPTDNTAVTLTAGKPAEDVAKIDVSFGGTSIGTVDLAAGKSMTGAEWAEKFVAANNGAVQIGGVDFNVTNSNGVLTFEMKETPTEDFTADLKATLKVQDAAGNDLAIAGGVNNTTNQNDKGSVTVQGEGIGVHMIQEAIAPGSQAQAQASFNLTDAFANGIKDGSALKIGNDTYIFAVGKDSDFKDFKGDAKIVDLTDQSASVSVTDLANVAAKRLSAVAADNKMFDVSTDNISNGVRLTERKNSGIDYDKNNLVGATKDNLKDAASAAWVGLIQTGRGVVDAKGAYTTGGLTLQIGDTSDEFNQLRVAIGDLHAEALGTASLDISTQEGATAAVDKIKAAINTVSAIRGTLGATSNRLDHTANNLSVMRENITDAESSIRDTDIAEEMMSYTKNNILVQSAQAMLAQANQVPQGVLQLLQ